MDAQAFVSVSVSLVSSSMSSSASNPSAVVQICSSLSLTRGCSPQFALVQTIVTVLFGSVVKPMLKKKVKR